MSIDISVTEGIATLRFNNPAVRNALSLSDFADLAERLEQVASDEAVEAIILTGKGEAFCAGLALDSVVGEDGALTTDKELDRVFVETITPLLHSLTRMPKPVVSAVNGVVAGAGIGLALNADVVLAAQEARFFCGFVPILGIVPDFGLSWLLPNLMGRNHALAYALLGEPIDAETARSHGLVWRVLPSETLEAEALAVAKRLAQGPREALLRARTMFTAAPTMALADMFDAEHAANVQLVARAEFREGISAFLEKRPPDFVGSRKKGGAGIVKLFTIDWES